VEGGDTMLTIDEVAKVLKVSYRSVWILVKAEKIKAVKVGKQWRISESEIEHIKEVGVK
jgi:excisionase family DNA binding protein